MSLPRQSTTESRLPAGLMSLTILQVLGTVWRRKWIIVPGLVVALSAAIIANGVITPEYTATATIIVEPREQKIVEFDQVLSNLPVSLETMQSEAQILQSPAVAKRVVDTLGLSALAEFNPALAPPEEDIADEVKTAIKGLFKPLIAWLREGRVDPRGVELAQAQTPGAWDLPPDDPRRAAGEWRGINRFLSNLDRKSTRLN